MTHFNLLNRMLQGCSAFIQTMAGDRAARNDAKRVNNHVLPLTCPLFASSLRLTCPLQLRRIALILCVLVMSVANIGMAWAQTSWVRLDSIDFTNTTNFPAVTYTNQSATVHGVFFRAKSGKNVKVNNTTPGVDFDGTNISSGDHGIAIPVTGVNGSLKVIVYHDYNNSSAYHRVGVSHATENDPSATQTWDLSPTSDGGTKNKNDFVKTKSSLTGTAYIVWVGEASSSYKVIKRVAIYTEAPSCAAADLTASNITSNGNQEAGTGITFSKVGSPASGDTWYWQTSATGTVKTYNATSPYTTATTAGSYTVYLRAYNTAADCWGKAASMTNTIYPAPSAMIHNTFAVNDAWGSTIATQDKTNITSLNAMAAVGESVGSGSNKSGLTQKIPSQSSEDADKYMSLSFNVASGKQLNVTSVVFDEQPVNSTGTFKVSISDNQGSATKTQTIASGADGSKHTLTLDGDIVGSFKGTVTVKVWAYGWSDGYRFGNYFYINGTVAEVPSCPAFEVRRVGTEATPAGGVALGSNAGTLTCEAVTGTIVSYQWKQNTSGTKVGAVNAIGTGVTSANFSPSPAAAGSYWYYCVATDACGNTSETGLSGEFRFNAAATWEVLGSWNSWAAGTALTGTGTVTGTVSLAADTRYAFKFKEGETWYGNGGTIITTTSGWEFSSGGFDTYLHTGPAGDYTFSINTSNKQVTVTYPTVTHPNEHYVYFKNSDVWGSVKGYMSNSGNDNKSAAWPGSDMQATTTICGELYHYAALNAMGDTYNTIIFNNGNSGYGNQTSDLPTTGSLGKYNANRDATWHDLTYTINYDKGIGTGTMAPTSVCVGADQVLPSNTFEKTGYDFASWTASASVKVGGSSVTTGIADEATIQDVTANVTLTAQWTPVQYDVTLEKGSAPSAPAGNSGSAKVLYDAGALTNIAHATWTGHVLTGYYTSNSGGTKVLNADGTFAAANVSGYITDSKWTRAENTTLKAQWEAKTTTITINANTANHGSTTPGTVTATYGSALPSFTAAVGASGYDLTGYFTAATDGTKIINADGTLVRNTTYSTDESTPKWNSEVATLTLFAQYEEEDVSPFTCITFNSTSAPSVSGVTIKKVAGDGGGSTYTEDGFYMSKSGDYITFDISALGSLTKATFTAKTNSTSKTIGYGYTDNTTTIGEVPGGSGTADKDFHEYEITGIPENTTRFTIIRKGTGTTITEVCLFYTAAACSNPVINEGSTRTSFAGGSWAQNSGHTITITATGASSYEWYRNTSPNDAGATKLSETSNTLDITTDVTPGVYYFKAIAKSGNCSSSTEWGWCGAMTITAPTTYTVTYNGSSAGGDVPVDASSPYTSGSTVTVLGNTGSLTRTISGDAATFYGWNTNSNMYGGTHYNAGETFTMPSSDVTLYAVWGYTITWNLNSGEWVDYTAPTYYIYGKGLTLPTAAKISRSGYTFDHWELEYNHSSIDAIADDATGNVTLNAIWTAAASSYSVTYNGNDNTGGSVPTDATSYSAGDIVTVKGNTGSLVKTGQTFLGWSTSATASSGTFYPAGYKFEMPASNVTLYAVWGSAAEEKYYYGSITITAGALTPGSTGTKGFFTNNGGEIATSSAISLSSTPGETGYYYESSTLTHTALNKSSNWNASSSSKRTIRAFKFKSGDSYTLALGSKVATSIMFYGKCGSASKTMSVGGQEYESPSTKEQFFSHEFTKVGNFTSNVTITQDGDFYGILVITISTGAASNFTVSFNMNGHGSAIDAIANVPSGSKIGKPIPDPAAVDWEFGGWYNEAGCTSAFDFANTTITANKTLYAKWTNCAPTITTPPVAASYAQNATATALTVAANDNGGGELHYQWWVKENDLDEETGSAIPGETGTSFIPSTELLGTSYYYCVVSNDCGNVFSNTAGITITDARPNPKANWDVAVPTHGGKGFSFSVEVNKNDDSDWDGTLTADMLTLSSEAVLGTVTVDNDTKTISGTYGVKGSATSPVTFYLLLPATTSQAAARLDYDQSFTECVGGSGDSYDIRVRKTTTKDGNYYHWANTDGWISQKIASSFSSEKASTKMGESEQFDSIYNTNAQYVWVRTYHANINKVRIYADFRANDMTVSNVYKHTDYFSEASKYIVGYTAVYNDDSDAANLGDAAQGYVDITLEEPMNANDIVLVKFNDAKVRTLGAVLTEGRSGGALTTSLEWSNSQDNGATLEKREDAVDFTITANRNDANARASLGTISYSSSNTSVATVNAATGQVTIADNIDFGSADYKTTTITATLAASGCYKRCVLTYVLQVNKYVCTEAVGTVSIQTDNGCSGKVLEVSGYTDGATIQWYKDGEVIPSATNATTYNATEGGTYYVVTHGECDAVSNELKISFSTATATKIVDEWYVKNGRRTPDIALVQTENATSFTVTSGGSPIDNIGGCKFYLGTDGIIYLKGQQDDGTEPNGLTAGLETITITASACGAASGLDIVIHKQEQRGDGKPEIAFVVDGTLRKDGGTATSVSAEKTSSRPIWEFLSTYYALTGCNAYWSVNSKELRQYYSQFDAILITDDPNTSTEGTGGVSYVKAFGTMVDVRPVLTMEAYVGKFKDGGWHVYNATPSSPNPRQVEMKLECKNHDIFVGLDPSTMDNVRTETINGDEYWFVTMVDTTQSPYHNTKDDHEALPALQGFDKTKFSNMLGVGTIKNDELQAGVERQEEPAARMMILGIQNNAMAALTTEGKMVVKNALDYLLKTDMEDVNDCANYFLGTTNNQWNVATNWSRGEVPDFETRARILRPVVVPNDYSARVARVDIASDGPSKKLSGAECTGSLTISPLGALVVSGKVSRVHAPYYGVNDLMPTEVSDVAIHSGTGGNGTLIMDDASGENKAYVQMYSKAVKGSPTTWQYIGIPHSDVGNAMDNYYDSWLYSWSPSAGWEVVPRGAAVTPWTGYCITYPTFGHKYEMTGTLVATADVDIDVPANSYQIIGNSWVAPIQIANFEDEDFGDITKTVYFFNTGHDVNGEEAGEPTQNAKGETRWAAGTYVAVPIHMAEYTGEDKIIPSMQGFYVANSTGSAGTLHLDYDKLVRQHGVSNYIQGQMHAPRRIAKGSNDPVMLKMIVCGSRYDDRLIVAEREDFTKGHDDGWDGAKWDGSTISPTIWSQNEEGGVESVTATPDMEGTIIGFRAGEDNEYTFHFEYDDMAEPLFLLDMDERMYVRILNDVTYTFTCADKGEHNRFLLTRKAPGIPTGCEPIDGGGGPKAMKFIKDNKLYILLNGVLYDATGKVVE